MGKAYDSARNYYQLVLLPLACAQLSETSKASADFPTGYEEKVDTKSWSEEQLQEYIRKEEMIAKFNDYAKSLARSSSRLIINLKSITQNYCEYHMTKHVYETILARCRLIVDPIHDKILMPS